MKYIISIALATNLLLFSCAPQYDAIDPHNTYGLGIVQAKEVTLKNNIGDYLDPIFLK